MEHFTFNGKSSEDFNLIISEKNIYSAPARDISYQSVPGRNGDVIIDNNRFENISISYTVGCKDIKSNIKGIKEWLCKSGYFKLTDSFEPEYFRLASFSSALDVTEVIKNVGNAKVSFNCKPFMYLTEGEETKSFTSSFVITNPESYDAEPYMKISGSGDVTLYINSKAYKINNISSYIEIDSELMAAYKGNVLCNNQIGFAEFPILSSGENSISWTGTVSKIEIKPRWKTL